MAEKKKIQTLYDIQIIRGWKLPVGPWFCRKRYDDIMDYMPEDGDIIITSYPKTGTTWLQYIVIQILSRGESFPCCDDVQFKLVPFLERSGTEALKSLSKPKLYKCHLPYHLVQKNPKAKYIYIYRKPEDALVSLYHFQMDLRGQCKEFKKFVEDFLTGNRAYGSYFEHVLTFYEHRKDENLLLLSYEKLHQNRREELLRIAKFLGEEYLDYLQKNEDVVDSIMEKTSFDYMKKNLFLTRPDLNEEYWNPDNKSEIMNFFRKGVIGDGQQTLSPEQLRRLKIIVRKFFQGTEIYEEWIEK